MSQLTVGTNPIFSKISEDLKKQKIKFTKQTGEWADRTQEDLFGLHLQGIITDSEHKKAFNRFFKKLVNKLEKNE